MISRPLTSREEAGAVKGERAQLEAVADGQHASKGASAGPSKIGGRTRKLEGPAPPLEFRQDNMASSARILANLNRRRFVRAEARGLLPCVPTGPRSLEGVTTQLERHGRQGGRRRC